MPLSTSQFATNIEECMAPSILDVHGVDIVYYAGGTGEGQVVRAVIRRCDWVPDYDNDEEGFVASVVISVLISDIQQVSIGDTFDIDEGTLLIVKEQHGSGLFMDYMCEARARTTKGTALLQHRTVKNKR